MNHQFLSILGAVIFLDQFTKYLASQVSIVQLNSGVSLGLISTKNQVILTTSIIFLMIALWLWQKPLWRTYPVISAMLFGGGISNIVDRILLEGVRDWLPVPGFNLVNNIADWSISLAIAAILLLELKAYKKHSDKEKHEIHS